MGHYYTPGRCLDCQWIIGDLPRCSHCGLLQAGPDADRIRDLLSSADLALRDQRAQSVAIGKPEMVPTAAIGGSWPQAAPTSAPHGDRPHIQLPPVVDTPKAPALTTPAVLLGLGATCVLVAAVVFVSVAWSDLSLGIKALILLGVTAGVSWVAAWMMRRGMRGSAEALTILATLLVALDFVAARSGGLLGLDAIGRNRAMWAAAAITMVVGLGWARGALATRTRLLLGVQLLALLAMWRIVMLTYDQHLTRTEYIAFGFVVVIVVVALLTARLALWTFAVFALVLAGLNLLIAFGASFVRIAGEDTVAGIWSSGRAVGWVACLLLAWLVAVASRLPMVWRTAAAAILVAGTSFLLLRPIQGAGYDAIVLTATIVFAVAAAASLLTRKPWRRGLRIGSVPVGLFAATLIGPSVMVAIGTALAPATQPWSMSATQRPDIDIALDIGIGRWWLIGIAAFLLMVAVEVVLSRGLPRPAPILSMAAVATAIAMLRCPLDLWAVVATLMVLATAMGAVAIRYAASLVWLLCAVFAFMAFGAALGSDVLTAIVAALFAIAMAGLSVRVRGRDEAILTAAVAPLFAGFSAVAILFRVGGIESAAAYVLVALGAVTLLLAQIRPDGRPLGMRVGVEVGGGVLCLAAGGFAATIDVGVQLPVVLTLAGAAFVAVALVSSDRRLMSMLGGVLVMSASWVRLAAVGVTAVEAYTLPSGVVLLVLGTIRMLRRPGTSSLPVMLPGLTLSLLPSLVVAVNEPTSLRALLLGIAATVAVLAGAYLRWVAPLLVGAAVLLVLAAVNLAPYAAAVPRWVLFGLLGAGLLYLGITWEKRLRNARTLIAAAERLA